MAAIRRVHVVTNDAVLARTSTVETAIELLHSFPGRVTVHVRGPRTSGRRIFEVATAIAEQAGLGGLVINDRVDVAVSLQTGVHLGARSMPVATVRQLVTEGTLIGRSIRHHAQEGAGADYLFAGPAFDTPSHEGQPGRGPEWIRTITGQTSLPVIAIGGISAERIGVLLDAGARGIALIRFVWEAPDPLGAVEALIAQFTDAS